MNETLAAWAPRVLSVLAHLHRAAIICAWHGKNLGFPAVPSFANVQMNSLVGASGLIELIGGALFTIGLFSSFSGWSYFRSALRRDPPI